MKPWVLLLYILLNGNEVQETQLSYKIYALKIMPWCNNLEANFPKHTHGSRDLLSLVTQAKQ